MTTCPTGAIVEPTIDARRCISYQRLNFEGAIQLKNSRPLMGNSVSMVVMIATNLGSRNRFSSLTEEDDFSPRRALHQNC